MQAKSVTKIYIVVALVTAGTIAPYTVATAQEADKAPPLVQVAVFDNPGSYGDNVPKVVVQTRDSLRKNAALEVMLFNPDSPIFTLAAKSAVPPIALTDVSTPAQQSAVATAIGAKYYVVLTAADRGKKLTAIVTDVATGAQQSIDKPEGPDAIASDIADRIDNWPPVPVPETTPLPTIGTAPATPPAVTAPAQPVSPAAVTAPAQPVSPAAVTAPAQPLAPPAVTVPAQPVSPLPPVLSNTKSALPKAGEDTVSTVPTLTTNNTMAPANLAPPLLSPGQPAAIIAPTLDTVSGPTKAPVSQPTETTAVTGNVQSADLGQAGMTNTLPNTPASPTSAGLSVNKLGTGVPPPPVAGTQIGRIAGDINSTVGGTANSYQEGSSASKLQLKTTPPVTNAGSAVGAIANNSALVPAPPAANDVNGPSVTISAVTVGNPGADQTVISPARISSPQPANPEISDEAKRLIDAGDASLQTSDPLSAISDYRKAVSLSPRAASPRLKLAQAYLQAGMKDQSSEEARRALAIDPGNTDVQSFIRAQDNGPAASGDVLIAQAQTESDPNNPTAWIALGDAYWNVADPDDALISYRRAADIDSTGVVPQTRLAKLYAARAQYDESLEALKRSGPGGYPFALKIIASRSESLVGDIEDETQALAKGGDTREQFYAKMKETDSQAQGLASFVAKIVPPQQYKVSQLHRELSTRLLAQTTAIWIDYAETNNADDKGQAADLEKHAMTEMQTASVAEDLQSRIKP